MKKSSDYRPKYPIYIPSRGRWESRLTARALEKMNCPYWIVVEPFEYDKYASVIDPAKILVLPRNDMKLIGSRNWIKEHSKSLGFKRHWQLDDNIGRFYRWQNNEKIQLRSPNFFRACEDFTDRYKNVAFSGLQYMTFVPKRVPKPPYDVNKRVYSCTLVNNEHDFNWRSIYNDDTDVCLMAFKAGWSTILFNIFQADKTATMVLDGGNTNELYKIEDGRLKMAQAICDLHPDVSTIKWKWGRWQHHVDYSRFKDNKLVRVDNYHEIVKDKSPNEYGMKLKRLKE